MDDFPEINPDVESFADRARTAGKPRSALATASIVLGGMAWIGTIVVLFALSSNVNKVVHMDSGDPEFANNLGTGMLEGFMLSGCLMLCTFGLAGLGAVLAVAELLSSDRNRNMAYAGLGLNVTLLFGCFAMLGLGLIAG